MREKILSLVTLLALVISSLLIGQGLQYWQSRKTITVANKNKDNLKNLFFVNKVVDGDTIHVNKNEEIIKVRLIGINTPETVDPRKGVECYGIEAKNYISSLLLEKWVEIETDPTQDHYDKYGRLLGYVFVDRKNINLEMIQEGYAYEYTYKLPYKYQDEFKLAETMARNEEKGLWNKNTCNGDK